MKHVDRETLKVSDIELVRRIKNRPPMTDESRPSRIRILASPADATTKKKAKLKGNERAISIPGIQRAAVRANILRVSKRVYGYCTQVMREFLQEFIKDAVISAKFNRRITIKEADVLDAARRHTCL